MANAMNILVTGATGYIGSQLVRRLLSLGHNVTAIVLKGTGTEALQPCISQVRVCLYDGTQSSLAPAFQHEKIDLAFHLASLFLVRHKPEDVDRLIASNVLFPSQLLEMMELAGVRKLVNAGTSWQHYQDAPYNPVNLYAATKQAFESLLEYYVQAQGFTAVTLKFFDTYGPGDNRPKLFSLLRKTARSGEPLKMSPGQQEIDPVYIDDVLDALVSAAERAMGTEKSETYGVCSGKSMTLQSLVGLYGEIVKRPLNIEWGGLPYRPREVMTPWKHAVLLPGWQARTPLREGIARMERDPSIGGLLAGTGMQNEEQK